MWVIPMGDEYDKRIDPEPTDTANWAMGGIEQSYRDGPSLLLDRVDGALKELRKLEEELSEIIERQVERRAHIIKIERMKNIRDWLMSLSDSAEQ
jgi:hypothetical protein